MFLGSWDAKWFYFVILFRQILISSLLHSTIFCGLTVLYQIVMKGQICTIVNDKIGSRWCLEHYRIFSSTKFYEVAPQKYPENLKTQRKYHRSCISFGATVCESFAEKKQNLMLANKLNANRVHYWTSENFQVLMYM